MRFSKSITAYLQGGLGNQLFIYAAALEQSKRLGCPLLIDTSHYLTEVSNPSPNVTPRTYELTELDLPGEVVSTNSPWYMSPPSSRKNALKNRILFPFSSVYKEQASGYDPTINSIRMGATLVGYFQHPSYSVNSGFELLNKLNTRFEKYALPTRAGLPHISIHIRRGDYLDPVRKDTQIIANYSYFDVSLARMKDKIGNFTGTVFSDSPDHVQGFIDKYPNLSASEDQSAAPIELLARFANADGLIMSNSSLSWWAARLLQHRNPMAVVIAPKPWHSQNLNEDLYMESWDVIE